MKKVAIVPLVMGVVLGGLAIKFGLDTIQEAKANNALRMVKTVVAAVDISATMEITKEMLKEIETPETPLLGEDGFASMEGLVGRVTAMQIAAGSIVRGSLLAPEGTPPGLTVRIKPGFRAVSVKIDEVTGVAYQLQPGGFVDVIAVMDVRRDRRNETISRILLQKVEVAAVGRTLSDDSESSGKAKVAKSVTLLVRDKDVPKLHLAQTKGRLTLAMRSADDDLESNPGNATESELLGLFGGAGKSQQQTPDAPAQQAFTGHSVTVVNGGGKQVELMFDSPDSMLNTQSVARNQGRPMRQNRAPQSVPQRPASPGAATQQDDEEADEPGPAPIRPS